MQANRSEFFCLVHDNRLAVVSTRPFLRRRRPPGGFARVEGYVARDPRIVARIRELAIQSAAPKARR